MSRGQELEESQQRQLQAGRAAQEVLEQRLRQESECRVAAEADVARQRQWIQSMGADMAERDRALQITAAQVCKAFQACCQCWIVQIGLIGQAFPLLCYPRQYPQCRPFAGAQPVLSTEIAEKLASPHGAAHSTFMCTAEHVLTGLRLAC